MNVVVKSLRDTYNKISNDFRSGNLESSIHKVTAGPKHSGNLVSQYSCEASKRSIYRFESTSARKCAQMVFHDRTQYRDLFPVLIVGRSCVGDSVAASSLPPTDPELLAELSETTTSSYYPYWLAARLVANQWFGGVIDLSVGRVVQDAFQSVLLSRLQAISHSDLAKSVRDAIEQTANPVFARLADQNGAPKNFKTRSLQLEFEEWCRMRPVVFLGAESDLDQTLADQLKERHDCWHVVTCGDPIVPSERTILGNDSNISNFFEGLSHEIGLISRASDWKVEESELIRGSVITKAEAREFFDEELSVYRHWKTRSENSYELKASRAHNSRSGSASEPLSMIWYFGEELLARLGTEGDRRCVFFIDDPTSPGGGEIRDLFESNPDLMEKYDGVEFATLRVSTSGQSKRFDLASLPIHDINAIAIVDSVAFTGETMAAAVDRIRDGCKDMSAAKIHCCTLYMSARSEKLLTNLECDHFYLSAVESNQIAFPWAWEQPKDLTAFDLWESRPIGKFVPNVCLESIAKPWGSVRGLTSKETQTVEQVTIERGGRTSMHYHVLHKETLFVLSGTLSIRIWDRYLKLSDGDAITIPALVPHQLVALGGPLMLIKLSDGICQLDDRDIVRLSSDDQSQLTR